MANCARCGADTILHVSGVPYCVGCDGKKGDAYSRVVVQPEKKRAASEEGLRFHGELTE
jgi:hypothetical protein